MSDEDIGRLYNETLEKFNNIPQERLEEFAKENADFLLTSGGLKFIMQ